MLSEKKEENSCRRSAERFLLLYCSSIVLGMNDALVEFTGALAGFSFALESTRLVALTGSITGIAAALSMAASEYLSTRSDPATLKCPRRAALWTGASYLTTVSLLTLPYLLFLRAGVALGVMLAIALGVIALYSYLYTKIRGTSFRRHFGEMVAVSFGVALLSFLIGYGLKEFS